MTHVTLAVFLNAELEHTQVVLHTVFVFSTVIIMNTRTAKIYTWKHTNAYQSKVMLMMYFRNVALINCRTPVIYFIMFKHSWKLSLFLHYYYNDLVYKYISICKTIGKKVFPIHVWKLATLFANLKQIHF